MKSGIPEATVISPEALRILVEPLHAVSFQSFLKDQGFTFLPPSGKTFIRKSGYLDKEGKPQQSDEVTLHEIIVRGTLENYQSRVKIWQALDYLAPDRKVRLLKITLAITGGPPVFLIGLFFLVTLGGLVFKFFSLPFK